MNAVLLLMDIRPEPIGETGWLQLVLLSGVVLVLSVMFAAGLVFFLVWYKRRQRSSAKQAEPMPRIQHLTQPE